MTVISWAAAAGVDPETRKRWGRWKPSTDEEYVKTSLTMVFERQRVLAERIRNCMHTKDELEEDEVLVELGLWLSSRGYTEEEVQKQIKRMMMRRGPKWRKSDGLGAKDKSPPIDIPQSATVIGERAFAKCKCLSEIKIPSSVGSFGDFAFERCDSLRNLFIDEGVASIGFGAFRGCRSLTSILISESLRPDVEPAFDIDILENVILFRKNGSDIVLI